MQAATVPDFWLYRGDIAVRKFPYDREYSFLSIYCQYYTQGQHKHNILLTILSQSSKTLEEYFSAKKNADKISD
jgi:hypothetical protein